LLRSDELKREEEARTAAQVLVDAQRLREEEAAARAAEEAQKRETFALLAKEFGYPPPAESVIHQMVRLYLSHSIHIAYNIGPSLVLHVRCLGKPAKGWKERPASPVQESMGPVH
jgi:hypothetical protein